MRRVIVSEFVSLEIVIEDLFTSVPPRHYERLSRQKMMP